MGLEPIIEVYKTPVITSLTIPQRWAVLLAIDIRFRFTARCFYILHNILNAIHKFKIASIKQIKSDT